jgi:transcriptional regulator with XRE-family HTH domain
MVVPPVSVVGVGDVTEDAVSEVESKSKRGARPAVSEEPEARDNQLELAIGTQVRQFRQDLHMTVAEVAKMAGLSPGMLSKIENGMTSPSLATLRALSQALNVPVTAFFRKYEDQRDATFVSQGQGLLIERRGTRAGHEYRLLGHTIGKRINVEPYLITLSESSEIFPLFQHAGVEFVYVLEGEMDYRHGGQTFEMKPGDSLFFDSDVPHGPERLKKLPIRMLSLQARAAE